MSPGPTSQGESLEESLEGVAAEVDARTSETGSEEHSVLIRGDTAAWRWLLVLEGVGRRAGDPEEVRRKKSLLVISSFLIAAVSPAWYLTFAAFGDYLAALFPLLFQLLTLLNLWRFRRSGDLAALGLGQVILLTLFPVGVHLSLGGVVASGAMVMWTFLAPLVALLGRGSKSGTRQFFFFSLVIVGCVLVDFFVFQAMESPSEGLPFGARATFFLFNLLGITGLTYVILRYFVAQMQAEKLEQRRLNRALSRAYDALQKASEHKSAFLAQMSHELRTPLNAIIGFSEMLEEDHGDMEAEELEADLRKIKGSGKHLLALINDILDLSKIEAGKLEIVEDEYDLRELIDEATATSELAIKKNGNALVVEVGEAVGLVKGDRLRTAQVLHNLLSNAAKFTEKGEVRLEVEHLLDAQGEGWVELRVRDTGIGISEAQQKNLFSDFTQADKKIAVKYGGTGLGLSLSRRLSRMMGGDIKLMSRLGEGSTFTVRLPDGLLPIERELRGLRLKGGAPGGVKEER